jgi:hypothetical protein
VCSIPGVRSAGLVNFAPLNAHFSDTTFTIDGRPLLPPGQFLDAVVRSADPSYFQAIGISAKRGAPGARTVKRLQRGGALGAPEAGRFTTGPYGNLKRRQTGSRRPFREGHRPARSC